MLKDQNKEKKIFPRKWAEFLTHSPHDKGSWGLGKNLKDEPHYWMRTQPRRSVNKYIRKENHIICPSVRYFLFSVRISRNNYAIKIISKKKRETCWKTIKRLAFIKMNHLYRRTAT